MKKTLSFLLALLLVFSLVPAGSAGAVSSDETALRIIRALEIMVGNESGDLMLEKEVTRAEFVKMAMTASTSKDKASAGVSVSPFPDVRHTHWAAGYVKTAVDLGAVNGYLDGTFRPDNTVRLEEAVNIVLKLLGYTASDLSGAFPSAQMSLYTALDLDEGLTAKQGDYLTRQQCAILLYNALCTQTKDGVTYCTLLGYQVDASGKIDYTAVLSDKMDGPIIATDGDWAAQLPFPLSQAESYTDIPVSSIKKNDVVYYSAHLKAVWVYREKVTGIYSAATPSETSPSAVVVDGTSYTIGNADAAYNLSVFGAYHSGDLITVLLGKDNLVEGVVSADLTDPDLDVDFSQIVAQTIEGPIIAQGNWTGKIDFSLDAAQIYYRGSQISRSQIAEYDVLYHSKALSTVWVFRDKVSGIINSVGASVSAPTTVTVSGTPYAIESTDAAYALSTLGTFRTGDSVTLLLGKDGGVAGIISSSQVSGIIYGVITQVTTTSYTDSTGGSYEADAITVLATDGNSYTYEVTSRQYGVGNLVSVTTGGGSAVIKTLGKKALTGKVNSAGTAIGSLSLADTVEILDRDGTRGIRIYASRLAGVSLTGDDVSYYQTNAAGEISHIILSDVTGDMHSYGVITSVNEISAGMTVQSTYGYNIGGVDDVFTSKTQTFNLKKGPAQFVYSGTAISKIKNLTSVSLDTLTGLTAQGSGGTYTLAGDVSVYVLKDSNYYHSSLSQITGDSSLRLTGWYDQPETSGGRIRVIVAQ